METLQEFCLDRIVTSFDRYYHAYKTSTNSDVHRGLLLLQRVYAHQLVARLGFGYYLKEKYADFVFNKFLKTLNTDWLTNFSWNTVVDVFQRIGPNLENVHFNHYGNDMPWEEVVRYIPNAKDIIYEDFCCDGFLGSVARFCPNLEVLNVMGSGNVSDEGIRYLCQPVERREKKRKNSHPADDQDDMPCPRLKEITLYRTAVEDGVMEDLMKKLPSLERVDYDNLPIVFYNLHQEELELGSLDSARKYNLVHLDLSFCTDFSYSRYFDKILEVCVAVCPKVKSLFCPVFKSEHLDLCCKPPLVEELYLCSFEDSGVDVSDFLKQKGGQLTSLSLRKCVVSLSTLGQYCRHLKELKFDRVTIHDKENDPVHHLFYNLERLIVRKPDLSKTENCRALCRILTSAPALEKLLFVMHNTMTPEMKAGILQCCERFALKHLYFWCPVDAEFLRDVLLTCTTLKSLDFKGDVELENLRSIAIKLPNMPQIQMY